jgi:hypothetical protein
VAGEPETGYVLVVCEGARCVPALVPEAAERPGLEPALVVLVELAARLRELGVIGRPVLLDERSGEAVAARRLWP